MGAGARPLPRPRRDQRAHRPAVRASDDRRRHHAARPLRPEQPVRHQRRRDALGDPDGAPVRDAAVRRALGPAGADGARPRDGGGRGVARRGPATVFRRIVLPNLVPAILSGAALAFARAVGEFGSIVLIAGNIPFKTEVASVFIFGRIESDAVVSAAAVLGRAPAALARRAGRDPRPRPPRARRGRRRWSLTAAPGSACASSRSRTSRGCCSFPSRSCSTGRSSTASGSCGTRSRRPPPSTRSG